MDGPAALPAQPIEMSASDRQFFQLGYALARASFAYADLAKKTVSISKTEGKLEQINDLAGLEPLAAQSRAAIKDQLDQAFAAIQPLRPTAGALAVVRGYVDEYDKPVAVAGDAAALESINPAAGRTLAALDEFERTSGLPESPPLHAWLNGSQTSASGRVWYAEGLIAGVAQIASQEDMPELLPNLAEIATDLRGLHDWILLRLPDQPSADQLALKANLDAFLRNVGKPATQKRPVTEAELARLGKISQQLVAQVLPQAAPTSLSAPMTPTPAAPSTTETSAAPVQAAGVDPGP
jgi:hypothetical protein